MASNAQPFGLNSSPDSDSGQWGGLQAQFISLTSALQEVALTIRGRLAMAAGDPIPGRRLRSLQASLATCNALLQLLPSVSSLEADIVRLSKPQTRTTASAAVRPPAAASLAWSESRAPSPAAGPMVTKSSRLKWAVVAVVVGAVFEVIATLHLTTLSAGSAPPVGSLLPITLNASTTAAEPTADAIGAEVSAAAPLDLDSENAIVVATGELTEEVVAIENGPVPSPTERPSAMLLVIPPPEAAMLAAINERRTEVGHRPVAFDRTLTEVARERSTEMARRKVFSHVTASGGSYVDALTSRGIDIGIVGEIIGRTNAAEADSVSLVAEAFVGSPAHNAHLVHSDYNLVGIAVAEADDMRYFTVIFWG